MAILAGSVRTTPALPAIKQSDLKDPTLIQLNAVFNQIWQRVIVLAGGAGTVNIPNTIVATSVQVPAQTQPPTDNSELLTLGSALALFAPGNTRQTLLQGAFQTNQTNVQQAQPLPPTQISSQAPISATSPGVPGQLAYDDSFIYICISPNTWKRVGVSTF